jgi:long-subunit acyl-CoA synthetase (AMP-forming)
MEDVRFSPLDITRIDITCRVGRVDDVLILANGEKVVPGPTEGALLVHPFVHSAVMFGRERTQVGILVEPVESHTFDPADHSALAAFRNAIWATVEEANSTLPAFGRLYKEMILVTHPSKPLPRAAKGTVNRKAAIKEYEQEINAMLVSGSYY